MKKATRKQDNEQMIRALWKKHLQGRQATLLEFNEFLYQLPAGLLYGYPEDDHHALMRILGIDHFER